MEESTIWGEISIGVPALIRLNNSELEDSIISRSFDCLSEINYSYLNLTLWCSFWFYINASRIITSNICILGIQGNVRMHINNKRFAVVVFRHTFNSNIKFTETLEITKLHHSYCFVDFFGLIADYLQDTSTLRPIWHSNRWQVIV